MGKEDRPRASAPFLDVSIIFLDGHPDVEGKPPWQNLPELHLQMWRSLPRPAPARCASLEPLEEKLNVLLTKVDAMGEHGRDRLASIERKIDVLHEKMDALAARQSDPRPPYVEHVEDVEMDEGSFFIVDLTKKDPPN